MTLRTRLLPSATPGVAWTAAEGLAGASSTGVAGTLGVTTPRTRTAGALWTRLWPTGTPGYSTQLSPTVIGAVAQGSAGFPEAVWSSAIGTPSNSATGVVGNYFLEITGATNGPGIYGTGEAGTIAVDSTVWGSADLDGLSGSGAVGMLATLGAANVNLTGPQCASAVGSIFTGAAFTVAAIEIAGAVGLVIQSSTVSLPMTGTEARGFAGSYDFFSRQVVRAIRVTAYLDVEI